MTDNTKPSIKILTIYYKDKPGGFCRRLRFKIKAFLDKGWEVHYIAVEPFPYTHPRLKPHILPTPMSKHDSLVFWLYFFAVSPCYLFWVSAKNKIDLITTGSPLYTFLCGPTKIFLQIPIMTLILIKPNFHTEWKPGFKILKHIEKLIERLGLRWSKTALANSWGSSETWKKMYGSDGEFISVLPNHVDTLPFVKSDQRKYILNEFALDSQAFIIIHTGLLQKRKNQECLIRALAELKNSNTILLLIGEGEEKEALQQLAKSMGVAKQVVFTGWRKDARELVQGADLFIFPSFKEGMAESLLEATTCELPCLVSSIPENVEVIRNPEQHFESDNPRKLAQIIRRLMSDQKFYKKLCDDTNEDSKRFLFDWNKKIVEKAEETIKNN